MTRKPSGYWFNKTGRFTTHRERALERWIGA